MFHFRDFNVPQALTRQTKCRSARIALPGGINPGLVLGILFILTLPISWLYNCCFFLVMRRWSTTNLLASFSCSFASANTFSSRDWDVEQLGATARVACTRSSRPNIAPSKTPYADNLYSSQDWNVEQLGATARVSCTRPSWPTDAPSNRCWLRPPNPSHASDDYIGGGSNDPQSFGFSYSSTFLFESMTSTQNANFSATFIVWPILPFEIIEEQQTLLEYTWQFVYRTDT